MSDPETWQDLAAALRPARAQHPLAFAPALSLWIVLRHADVSRLLGDSRLTSGFGAVGAGVSGSVMARLLANREGEPHLRLRRLVTRAFTPRQIELTRVSVRGRVAERIAALRPGSEVDLRSSVAEPLAREGICELLGVPAADAQEFGGWIAALLAGVAPFADSAAREVSDAAALQILEFIGELAARRRREPGESLLDALLAAEHEGEPLSPADLEDVVMSLLLGGTDTVRSFLTIVASLALQYPEMLGRLRAEPSLAAAFVEEALRFESPVLGVPRVCAAPIELGGVELPTGSQLILNIFSANRDPARFAEPDRFEPLRDASAHLTFGRGTHFCVGAALARMQAQELVLGLAAEAAPTLELTEKPRWIPFDPARRLSSLDVRVA